MTPAKEQTVLDQLLSTMVRGTGVLLAAAVAFSALASESGSFANEANEVEIGRRIYQDGVLPEGVPLKGLRRNGTTVEGSEAACVNCHRRSGMGSVEGDIQVPPITGKALFAYGDRVIATMNLRSGKAWNQKHAPYTDETLASAIQTGVNNSGREMNIAMPHYVLEAREMKALAAYLKQLSSQWSPGVTAETIRFATVITPEVAPERKKIMLDMLRAAFAQKNGSTVTRSQARGRRHMVTAAEMVLGTERNWVLDVWELQGAPETWAAQLEGHYQRQPVFALVSGLSSGTWQPVHDFCEREQVPCWFPSVDLPTVTDQAFYPVYFSRGVMLEADVLARHLSTKKGQQPRQLVQVRRDDPMSLGAAQALSRALAGSGITVEDRLLDDTSPDALRRALVGVQGNDAVMFWLRPADLAMLNKVTPPVGASYFSARLAAGSRTAIPASWKGCVHLIYPYELPEQSEINLAYFHQWLKLRNLPLVDEPLQSEIYFSLNFLTDTLAEMLDNLYRDYLMERAESMISTREGKKIEEEALARNASNWRARSASLNVQADVGSPKAGQSATPGGTTVYPHLSLGPTQRFASKGGYIVRFASATSDNLVAETAWIIP